MSFKKYPQPPFKKYIKCQYGKILESNHKTTIEPAVYNKKGMPLFQFGWVITYNINGIKYTDRIITTADSLEELK